MRPIITLILILTICVSCGTRKIFEVDTVTDSSLSGLYSDTTRHFGTPLPEVELRFFFGTVNRVRKIGLGMDTLTNGNGTLKLSRPQRPLIMDNAGWVIASKNRYINDTIQFDFSELKQSRIIINLEEEN